MKLTYLSKTGNDAVSINCERVERITGMRLRVVGGQFDGYALALRLLVEAGPEDPGDVPRAPRAVRMKVGALAAYSIFGSEFGAGKDQWRTLARMAFVWAMRQQEDPPSYAVLSRLVERKDHKAALYLYQRAEELRERDDAFRVVTDQLLKL
jgi:hypothetical protein